MRLAFAVACLHLALAAPSPAAPVAPADPAWAAACHHFVDRARFKPRTGPVEAATVIAEACPLALAAASAPDGEAARRFLARLAAARAMVAAMNQDRFARAEAPGDGVLREVARTRRLVTATGEFLILRGEGVFEALELWARGEARFALRAALP